MKQFIEFCVCVDCYSAMKQKEELGRQQLEREVEELRAQCERYQQGERSAASERAALVRQLEAHSTHLGNLQQQLDAAEADNRRLNQVMQVDMRTW